MTESPIKEEQEFYKIHKAEYVEKYLGKEVLIYKKQFWGAFDTCAQALDFADKNNFARDKFIIKTVQKKEPKIHFLGLWSA